MAESNSGSNSIVDLFKRLFDSILGGYDSDKEKKKLLKEIEKDLRKQGKFFKSKGHQAQPALAEFFYTIYKNLGPAKTLLEKYANSDVLKKLFVEKELNKEAQMCLQRLGEESIKERGQTTGIKQLREEVKKDLIELYGFFDMDKIRLINRLYNDFLSFYDFIDFDYYFLLKKFDSGLPENDYTYSPRFESINIEYIGEDLKDYLVVANSINDNSRWDELFQLLQEYRNISLVSKGVWKKILQSKTALIRSKVLLNLVKIADEDPYYKETRSSHNKEVVESFLNGLKSKAEENLKLIGKEKKDKQIGALLNAVFGTTAISRTQNYTEKENIQFIKKGVDGYKFIEPINFLKAFYLDIYKSKIRQLIDILLIQGKWTTNIQSQQFSDNYHQLLNISTHIVDFDNNLAEDSPGGQRLRRLARSANSNDRLALNSLAEALNETNEEARKIISDSVQGFILLGKTIKSLIEDLKNSHNSQIIINWKELDTKTDHHLGHNMTEIYKQLYYLIQLIQNWA